MQKVYISQVLLIALWDLKVQTMNQQNSYIIIYNDFLFVHSSDVRDFEISSLILGREIFFLQLFQTNSQLKKTNVFADAQ